jgi:hypothetical protein
MWESIRNLKTSELELREPLNDSERDWLVGCLTSRRGIRDALCDGEHACRLLVEYDANFVNVAELLDFLYLCGIPAEPAPSLHIENRLELQPTPAGRS